MIVYSTKIIRFIQEITSTIKSVLTNEIGLKVFGNRFYDYPQTASYPIKVVIYNNKRMLGYFDADFYELGFHECLMHSTKTQLHALIRHELAHYITFMLHGPSVAHHGQEFRGFCRQMGWGEEVYKATTCLEDGQDVILEETSVLRKIQKLMALAQSSNQNEAEQAMIKSQQLLLKHNIESTYFEENNEEKTFLKRILKQKKESAKMRSIAKILETFFVNTVYSRAGDFTYLEILGNATNVEIADHVASVLNLELETLWKQAQQQANLKGTIAKNSFFLGLAKGYCNKIHALKKAYTPDIRQALIVIEKKLVDAKNMAYPRLTSVKRSAHHCHESSLIGEQMGRKLSINPAVNKTSQSKNVLIGCESFSN